MNFYIAPYSSGVQAPLPDRLRYEGSSYLLSYGSSYARLEVNCLTRRKHGMSPPGWMQYV
ncbi:hypothetical protein ARMGADRAFT_1018354 [Armillaria gallica]|uniref:Uncharacterized protein n=1 Tax=Armillaria gallica TaxID=47427 RepID=A0A2H3D8Q2_ARMGA|nr:hypothetical protein ARMGADRAFT_1018354 [Armillaria gallica]